MLSHTDVGHWIWDDGPASPRNAWRFFRRTLTLDAETLARVDEQTMLHLSADTRYLLWVNGTPVGHGPVRGHPDRWFFDSWPVGHLLVEGENVIAVHVVHLGVATMSYLRNRGGLRAALELPDTILGTDQEWRVHTPAAHDPRSNRLSVQLGFTETWDARRTDVEAWRRPGFDDSGWVPATVIDPASWPVLLPRDIPPLQEQPVRAERVVQLAEVQPPAISHGLDLRAQMSPEAADHADHVGYRGWLLWRLRVQQDSPVVLRLIRPHATVVVDGRVHRWEELADGGQGTRVLPLEPGTGERLVLAEVSAIDHGHTVFVTVQADPGTVELVPVLVGSSELFATVGPVTGAVRGDAERPWQAAPPLPDGLAERVEQVGSVAELAEVLTAAGVSVAAGLRPVPEALVSPVCLFPGAVFSRRRTVPVPRSVQTLASGLDTVVPRFEGGDTELVLDLGRELSGFWELEVSAPAGTVLDLYGLEYLDGDHREDTFLLDNTLRLVCGGGRQRYRSPSRRGLRHLQVTVRHTEATDPVVLHQVSVAESHHAVTPVGSFRCSDARLEQIWEMSRRTVLACMEDTYVDCPAYEQVMWVGDSYSSSRFAAALFGAEDLTRRCLRLAAAGAAQNPLIGSHGPSAWDAVIPNWTYFWVWAVREHWFRTDDRAFAGEIWPQLDAALTAHLGHLDGDGLLNIRSWNLLDWAPLDQPGDGVVSHQNMLLVIALDAAADVAEAAGDGVSVERLRASAERLRDAIDAHLWSEADRAWIDAIHADGTRSEVISVHTQMFALLSGVARGERRRRAEEVVTRTPTDWVQIGSPWMSIFRYDALALLGHADVALADLRRDYQMMLDAGASTCWEMFPSSDFLDGRDMLSRSHCHAWSAAPASFLPEQVLGISATVPGWRALRVRPEVCDLDWARGRVPLPGRGHVEVSWRITEGRMRLDVQVPAGIEVDAVLPDGMEGEANVVVLE